MTDHIPHRSDCTQPKIASMATPEGLTSHACLTCGASSKPRLEAIPTVDLEQSDETTQERRQPVTPTNYRCRDHQDEFVTWRGTGCRVCARERTRPRPQLAPRPRNTNFMETQ